MTLDLLPRPIGSIARRPWALTVLAFAYLLFDMLKIFYRELNYSVSMGNAFPAPKEFWQLAGQSFHENFPFALFHTVPVILGLIGLGVLYWGFPRVFPELVVEQEVIPLSVPNTPIPTIMQHYRDAVARAYNSAAGQDTMAFHFSIGFAVAGFAFIVVAFFMGKLTNPAAMTAAVVEILAGTIFWISRKARVNLDKVFVNLQRANDVERAYDLLQTQISDSEREALTKEIIRETLINPEQKRIP